MIVTAKVDLTENGDVAILDEFERDDMEVLVYADRDNQPLQAALDAIARLRLVAEGHARSIEILPAVAGSLTEESYHWLVSPDGTEVVRRDGRPYRMEARRG